MNKRQRKKLAKKYASAPCRALINSTRAMLRRDTLMSEAVVNDAWRKFQDYLSHDLSKASGTHAAAGKT